MHTKGATIFFGFAIPARIIVFDCGITLWSGTGTAMLWPHDPFWS